MQDVHAASKADEFIKMILQHRPEHVLPTNCLASDEQAVKAAQAIATLRAELIERLKPQQ